MKTNLYVMPTTSKPYKIQTSGKITEIVFSCQELEGYINGQYVKLIGKNIGQHSIKFNNDNVVLDLTLSSPDLAETGYLIVYKEFVEKECKKSKVSDDLEGE